MRDLATLKNAGQQRVAVLDIGEVLARHAGARRSGLLQTIQKFHSFSTIEPSSDAVHMFYLVDGVRSRAKSEESAAGGTKRRAHFED